jgi:hypothetical protein
MVSRFHVGVIKSYAVEYDLEPFRYANFKDYPSRLHSKYLFKSREEAQRYRETHVDHVSTRILKRGVTGGPYVYSLHDLGWVDFLRIGHSMDVDNQVLLARLLERRACQRPSGSVDGPTLDCGTHFRNALLRARELPEQKPDRFRLSRSLPALHMLGTRRGRRAARSERPRGSVLSLALCQGAVSGDRNHPHRLVLQPIRLQSRTRNRPSTPLISTPSKRWTALRTMMARWEDPTYGRVNPVARPAAPALKHPRSCRAPRSHRSAARRRAADPR